MEMKVVRNNFESMIDGLLNSTVTHCVTLFLQNDLPPLLKTFKGLVVVVGTISAHAFMHKQARISTSFDEDLCNSSIQFNFDTFLWSTTVQFSCVNISWLALPWS